MTDEPASTVDEPVSDEPNAEAAADGSEPKIKLHQTVESKDVGPCKKYVKVTISREDVDRLIDGKFKELASDAVIPGFRPGKAPRSIVVRKFRKQVDDQVKMELLVSSLEQMADEQDFAALSMPNIDPGKMEIPKDGPFVYEFEVEVRPEFDLPNYKGLKIKRPTRKITEDDVRREELRVLSQHGQLVPKPEGNAEIGDYLIADMITRWLGKEIGQAKELKLRVDDTLAFKDAIAKGFLNKVRGAKAGDTFEIDMEMTEAAASDFLKGQTVQAMITVQEVKKLRLPELTHEFLHTFGLHTPEQFHEYINIILEKRLEYEQRQSARAQILQQLTAESKWDLPHDLLQRQAAKAFQRRVMEMREMGITEEEIKARQRMLERDVIQSSAASLQEHFVLQKVADLEKIDINEDDLNAEIESIADQRNESPRRLRAQLERDGLLDALASQMVERLALSLIMDTAVIEEETVEAQAGLAAIEEQAVPGEMKDPTAAPPEEKKDEEKKEEVKEEVKKEEEKESN